MNEDQFDKEISKLYQQRKSQLVAPKVMLPEPSIKTRYSGFKILSIFTLGGIASFGIMAIVSHFANNPQTFKPATSVSHPVDVTDIPIETITDTVIVLQPVLPAKPEVPSVPTKKDLLVPLTNQTPVNNIDNFALNRVKIINLPQLKSPKISITPIYKVLPKYSDKAVSNTRSGAIKLRYEIDGLGNVQNIDVVSNEASRDLARSAKKALAKWKYNPDDVDQRYYEVIFEFNGVQ
jgi:TonB family protein